MTAKQVRTWHANGNTRDVLGRVRSTGHERGKKFPQDAVDGKASGRWWT